MTRIINVSDIVEENGKTIRQNNLERTHKHKLGEIVEVDLRIWDDRDGMMVDLKGTCRLYVVAHTRDCDGTPLYAISSIPVMYPIDDKILSPAKQLYESVAKIFEHGYGEESLRPTGKCRQLYPDVRTMFGL